MTSDSRQTSGAASPSMKDMTTQSLTTATTTTKVRVRAISAGVLSQLRVLDDAGNRMVPFSDAEGGSPLRCCLRRIRPGQQVALVSYAPLRRWAAQAGASPGAYDEVGPVFIHAAECPGPAGRGFPAEFTGARWVFRAYSAAGTILGGRLASAAELADPAHADSVLAEVLAAPAVAVVHVRAVEFGCFAFEATDCPS
jgi:hypothetical protein